MPIALTGVTKDRERRSRAFERRSRWTPGNRGGRCACEDDDVTATDSAIWIVDVVLRANGRAVDEEAVVAAAAQALGDRAEASPQRTSSSDMSPPDGSIGVSCRLRAGSAGEAVDEVIRFVSAAAAAVTGDSHPLWDVRALPDSAVLQREEAMQTDDRNGRWRRLRR